jgi:transcriptional regulator with XRE-family HTH domain
MSGDELTLTAISHRLRSAREAMTPEMTAAEAARAVGVGPVQMSRYETGKETPPLPRLFKFAELYSVDIVWLVHGRGHACGNKRVSSYLASPMAGVVTEDIAERLRRMPYDLFGYDEPDESDVAQLHRTLELHLANATLKRRAASQPTPIEPPEPPPPAPEPAPTVPKRGRKRARRSE